MFGEESHEDIINRWFSEANVWNKDQTELTKAFNAWNGPKKIYTDKETGFRRLCRSFLERKPDTDERKLIEDKEKIRFYIRSGFLTDYHAISNKTHSDLNEYIVDSLYDFVDKSRFIPNETYVSYLPLLFEAIVTTNSPIIECGMGNGSTPVLHSLDRHVISYETNEDWFHMFDVPNKYLVAPDSWVSLVNMHKSASPIVFLDQAPGESREQCITELLTDFDGIIVAHDTEPAADHGYKMRQHFSKFKYVVEVKTNGAWATAMSNTIDIRKWIGQRFGDYVISGYDHPQQETPKPVDRLAKTVFARLGTRFH
jgi:hypothetical protein